MLSLRDRAVVQLQLWISRAFTLATYYASLGWMRLGRRYRIPSIRRIREEFEKLLAQGEGPVVICANHLTFIDSLLIIWALAPGWKCFMNSSCFPWNLPEKRNFHKNLFLRGVCYFGKCIAIIRQGPREQINRAMAKVNYLLSRGESVMIFPEGGRSRKGSIDRENFTYGVGAILQSHPKARVLCVYLRGQGQKQYSDFPKRGEEFHIDLRMIKPASESRGLRGAREISTKILHTLIEMEERFFERVSHAARQ